MRRPQWISSAATVLTVLATMLLIPAAPAVAATCADPGLQISQKSWHQRLLGSDEVLAFSRGANIRVAVLGTGVDGDHERLRGKVLAGYDAVARGGAADDDCIGHGTQVAGVIATPDATGQAFHGLAPDATIVPIRVAVEPSAQGVLHARPQDLAAGLSAAIDLGVQVIAVAVPSYTHTPQLQDTVERALAAGITVVAAVGDLAGQGNPTPYPAAYDGVLGVGAVDQNGRRWERSQWGDYVDIVAPGVDLFTLQTGSGMTIASGTGVACGIVAATAALIRSRWPDLAPERIPAVLLGTATPGAVGDRYGRGVVNPYAAVTNQIVDAEPVPLPAPAGPAPAAEPDPAAVRSRNLAIGGAAAAVLLTIAVAVGAVAIPRGRRRRWRGTLAPRTVARPEPEEPGPPVLLFGDRAPTRP